MDSKIWILLLVLAVMLLGEPLLIILAEYVLPSKWEESRLIRFIRKGDAKKVRKLLAKNPARHYLDDRDSSGMTPLMLAAREGHKEIVQILIDEDIDVNRKNGKMTALTLAREGGHADIVDLLKGAGALEDFFGKKLTEEF